MKNTLNRSTKSPTKDMVIVKLCQTKKKKKKRAENMLLSRALHCPYRILGL